MVGQQDALLQVVHFHFLLANASIGLILSKGRLAEIPDASILLIEAGDSNDQIEATQYAGG